MISTIMLYRNLSTLIAEHKVEPVLIGEVASIQLLEIPRLMSKYKCEQTQLCVERSAGLNLSWKI